MKKMVALIAFISILSAAPGGQQRLRVFVGHTHTGTDQIGERFLLEVNQQLKDSTAYTPAAVPQDADVVLLLTSIDPDLNTPLAGRRSAIAQVVTFPPLTVIDYAIDIVPADQIKKAANSAVVDMGKAVLSAAKK